MNIKKPECYEMKKKAERSFPGAMDEAQRKTLIDLFAEKVLFEQPMEQWTTFRVGGNADALCFVEDMFTLRRVLEYAKKTSTPYLILGKGSNLLVKDLGLRGLALLLRGHLALMERSEKEGDHLSAGAGLHLSNLLNECRRRGLGGLEFLAGIPGTVGGAVLMNAGAWGKETADVLQEIEIMSSSGELIKKNRAKLHFAYRSLDMLEGSVVVKATFKCTKRSSEEVEERMRHYREKRKNSQPLEYASGGSVFQNPPGDFAGRLIEQVGLKGFRVGGAVISSKHANFIVNTGGAKACDVLALMDLARKKVREKMGVDLQPEIRVVGK
ncbi:MAG: UDP-N-acetylmuramate dehydrogenase [Deltaproteobacteria bacterium]|nr:UDP-N-acetylmuramate dehydrogenase [Deltaproteobacteria bacterium]